jgi:hypothetical protein
MKAELIEKYVAELRMDMKILSVEDINKMDKYFTFKNDPNTKMLYEIIIKGDFNKGIFKEMMRMKRRLEDGEDQYSVDVRFGQFMADKYLPKENGQ